jgi:hypothetical protein
MRADNNADEARARTNDSVASTCTMRTNDAARRGRTTKMMSMNMMRTNDSVASTLRGEDEYD